MEALDLPAIELFELGEKLLRGEGGDQKVTPIMCLRELARRAYNAETTRKRTLATRLREVAAELEM